MGLEDVASISRLRVVTLTSNQTRSMSQRSMTNLFPSVKHVTYHEIKQSVFNDTLIKMVRLGGNGVKMLDLGFKRMVYLFVQCTTLFLNSYYNGNY